MSLELKNIKNLIKVQLKQKLQLIWFIITIVGIFCISSIADLFNTLKKTDVDFIIDLNSNTSIISLLFIPFLCLLTTNILSNNEIVMYPGTIKTRFISRIITDHIYLTCSYLILVAINTIINLIVVLTKISGKPLNVSMLFDIKYLLTGFIIYISLGFMVYMVFIVMNMIISRIHYLATIGISITIVMLFKYKIFDFNEFLNTINSFFMLQNMGIGTLVFRSLIVWVFLLILAYFLTFTVKKWYMPLPQFKVFTIWLVEIILFIIIAFSCHPTKDYNDIDSENHIAYRNSDNEKSFYMEIPKDFSAIDFNYYYKDNSSKYSTYSVNTCAIDYEKAQNHNLITSDMEIPKGQMFVNISTPVISVNGKEIPNNIVNSIEIDFKNKTIDYPVKDEFYVVNHFLGNLCQFEKDYSEENDYTNYDERNITITVIYNE